MLMLLIYFIVACIMLYGIKAIVPMTAPLDKVFYVLCVLVALYFLVWMLKAAGVNLGHLPPMPGK